MLDTQGTRDERAATGINRGLLAALIVTALVGPVVGFAAGRAGVDEPERVAADGAAGGDDTTEAHDPAEGGEDAPGATADADTEGADGADTGEGDTASAATAWAPGELRPVLVRDVGDVRVRLYQASYPVQDGNPFWDPPEWCWAQGNLVVEMSTPEMAAVEWVERYVRRDGAPTTHAGLVGTSERSPVWYALVADDAATSVAVTFPDGSVDTADVVDGVAVLATRAPASTVHPPDGPRFQATVTSPAGTAAIEVRPYWEGFVEGGHPGDDPACQPPPPELPPAGEQPADPAAARAAVAAAYDGLYGTVAGASEGRHHLEDPDALADVLARVAEGALPVPADTSVSIQVQELVFDRPDHAWLRYDLAVEGLTTYRDRVGEALVVDGSWRVANATLCADLALGGLACE